MKHLLYSVLLFFSTTVSTIAAVQPTHIIAMTQKSAETFYIQGAIQGIGNIEFLVDTGSSYVTINEQTLATLKQQGKVSYVKDMMGILANGKRKRISVYRIDSIRLSEKCELHDVEAAVFPGHTRHILGLSALKKVGAFTFSFDPPQLILSKCMTTPASQAQAQKELRKL